MDGESRRTLLQTILLQAQSLLHTRRQCYELISFWDIHNIDSLILVLALSLFPGLLRDELNDLTLLDVDGYPTTATGPYPIAIVVGI